MTSFIDITQISVASGNGGDGQVAWRREKYVSHGGPAGGDGGKGGSVYLEATEDINTLVDFQFKKVYQAPHGENGRSKNQHGKSAQDLIIKVPCGTVIKDADSGDVIGDLTESGQSILVAAGGRGGRGNTRFLSTLRKAPEFAEPGEPGVTRGLILELKLLADVGLLGLPNAGKSTLLSVITNAKPKIANYPFTTIVPNLGVATSPYGERFVLADIPGLIEGASQGQGLGHDFLRHVERNRLLWHLLDISPEADMPAEEAYTLINLELQAYSQELSNRPRIILLTKADTLGDTPEEIEAAKLKFEKLTNYPVFVISSATQQGLEPVLQKTTEMLAEIPKLTSTHIVVEDTKAYFKSDDAFTVTKQDDGAFVVSSAKMDHLTRMTNLSSRSALNRLIKIYKSLGLEKELKQCGCKPGDTIIIGQNAFEYWPDDMEGMDWGSEDDTLQNV